MAHQGRLAGPLKRKSPALPEESGAGVGQIVPDENTLIAIYSLALICIMRIITITDDALRPTRERNMTTIVTINHPEAKHLSAVKADMMKLGAPLIRAIRDDAQGVIIALEGSHRLAAAHDLGITPVLRILGDNDMISCDDIGYDDMGWFDGEPARAVDIRNRIGQPQGTYSGCNFLKFENVEVA